jgi:hypothetical protein
MTGGPNVSSADVEKPYKGSMNSYFSQEYVKVVVLLTLFKPH